MSTLLVYFLTETARPPDVSSASPRLSELSFSFYTAMRPFDSNVGCNGVSGKPCCADQTVEGGQSRDREHVVSLHGL